MTFAAPLKTNEKAVLSALGYRHAAPDEKTAAAVRTAIQTIESAAQPRWNAARFSLAWRQGTPVLEQAALPLPGQNIRAHLTGCAACLLLGVTLGAGVDAVLRTASATDMHEAVLLDTAASVLVEQYVDEGQALATASCQGSLPYSTSRFSPGYGDFPIALQKDVIRLLNAGRAMGLSVSESGILLPRKSITALIGLAAQPVTGQLAGCGDCAIKENCNRDKPCANPPKGE